MDEAKAEKFSYLTALIEDTQTCTHANTQKKGPDNEPVGGTCNWTGSTEHPVGVPCWGECRCTRRRRCRRRLRLRLLLSDGADGTEPECTTRRVREAIALHVDLTEGRGRHGERGEGRRGREAEEGQGTGRNAGRQADGQRTDRQDQGEGEGSRKGGR